MRTIDYKLDDEELKLRVDDDVFNPTSTSQYLAQSCKENIRADSVVLDLGCGVED